MKGVNSLKIEKKSSKKNILCINIENKISLKIKA
jgi:hypothetical protein